MFDGKVGIGRNVSGGGRRDTKNAKDLVEKARKERELRAVQRLQNDAAKKIQTLFRKVHAQSITFTQLRKEFDKKVQEVTVLKAALKSKGATFLIPVPTLLYISTALAIFFRINEDGGRLLKLQALLQESVVASDSTYNVIRQTASSIAAKVIFTLTKSSAATFSLLTQPETYRSPGQVDAHLAFLTSVLLFHRTLLDAQAQNLAQIVSGRIFTALCRTLKQIGDISLSVESENLKQRVTLTRLCDMCLEHLFLFPDHLQSKFTLLGTHLLSSAKLASNKILLGFMERVASHEIIRSSEGLLVGLLSPSNTDAIEDRFHRIANMSQIFLGPSKTINNSVVSSVLLPWMSAVRSVFDENDGDSIKSSIPLALYLCQSVPGFQARDENRLATAMDVDGDDGESHHHLQQQEQDILNEYMVGDGQRKIEIRITMILNEIAQREARNHHGASLAMGSIESILRVLTNKEVVSQLFDVLQDQNQEISSRMALISTFTKVLVSFPYKIGDRQSTSTSATSKSSNTTREALLTTLAFSRPQQPIAIQLWLFLQEYFEDLLPSILLLDKRSLLSSRGFQEQAALCNQTPEAFYMSIISLIYLFCSVLSHQLAATDDEELFSSTSSAMSVGHLVEMTRFLRQWLWKILWTDPSCDFMSSFLHPREENLSYFSILQYSCLLSSTRLFNQLCIRNERRTFLEDADYQWSALPQQEFALVDPTTSDRYYEVDMEDNVLLSSSAAANKEGDFFVRNPNLKIVLTYIPQVIPFTQRVALFQSLVDHDKQQYFSALQGRMSMEEMIAGGQIVRVSVRRDRLVEDAMKGLHNIGFRLKGRVQVEFISEQGFQEAGIDGGGLFKEFMDVFARTVSDPAFGIFVPTSEQLLTPNPYSALTVGHASSSSSATSSSSSRRGTAAERRRRAMASSASAMDEVDEEDYDEGDSQSKLLSDKSHLELFEFVGKMLGKALYEKILYQSELAPGFLNILLGRTNSLDDLFHLDSTLYRSLLKLKEFAMVKQGNVEDLELFFTTDSDVYGQTVTEELLPNGSSLRVNNANILLYIHRLAHFKQNLKIRDQCRAFLKGFRVMIPIEWLRMFNTQELQLLISGDKRRIDIQDMKRHVVYASGYHESQPYIQAFWDIVENMSAEDQGNLLKFVTSCPRQPLLGFKEMNPRFCIQRVPVYQSVPLGSDVIPHDEQPRLPTAATCMNLLKLPQYASIATLREKLLYAVQSNSGFELS